MCWYQWYHSGCLLLSSLFILRIVVGVITIAVVHVILVPTAATTSSWGDTATELTPLLMCSTFSALIIAYDLFNHDSTLPMIQVVS
jgi:hypothetical protein